MADKSDTMDWSQDEVKQLLDKLLSKTKCNTKSYKAMESSINWEEVGLEGKTASECKEIYQRAINKVRKYRTMTEILHDAQNLLTKNGSLDSKQKQFPDMPKKPITAFGIFVKKKSKKFAGVNSRDRMAQLGRDWNALSEERKDVYKQKYLKLKRKYDEQMEEFKKKHPSAPWPGCSKTKPCSVSDYRKKHPSAPCPGSSNRPQLPQPSRLFVNARLQKEQAKHPDLSHGELLKKLLRKYEKLDGKKKLKWINRAKNMLGSYQEQCNAYISQHPSANLKPPVLHLNKTEQKILDESVGKPVHSPPKNVFLYYCHTQRDSVSHLQISEQSKILSTSYHKLSEEELAELRYRFQEEVEAYIADYTKYYESLEDADKQHEKPPDVMLAGYYKILQKSTPKPTAAQKSTENLQGNDSQSRRSSRRQKNLSELLPRHTVNHNVSDSEKEEGDSSDETLPLSFQGSEKSKDVNGRKRKFDSPNASSAKKKKPKESPSADNSDVKKSPSKGSSSSPFSSEGKGKTDIQDNLLAMWSPLRVKSEGTSQEEQSPSPRKVKEHKSPKKSKRKSKEPEM